MLTSSCQEPPGILGGRRLVRPPVHLRWFDGGNMNATSFLREQIGQATEFLAGAMADIDGEMAHVLPPGRCNSIAATYAHVLTGEDGFVNGLLRGRAPLFTTDFAGATGISELPPEGGDWHAWGAALRVDFGQVRRYASAVHAATDEYVASLSDDDFDRTVDLSSFGFGSRTVGWVLGAGVLGHRLAHWGEICALKGLHGGTGFPR
jgi:hypothetical protein